MTDTTAAVSSGSARAGSSATGTAHADYGPGGRGLIGGIDSRPLAAIFCLCAALYLGIYALEAPLRYALYLFGKDNLILLRDGLIAGPLVLLFAAQALRLRIHPAFIVFAVLIAFHGLVLMGTVGSPLGAAYGVKILINLLFGFFAASLLIQPGSWMTKLLLLIWLVTMVGVVLDKFVLTFPWTGIRTVVGELNVDVSKDWQIQDTVARRVAGFTRSSISVAAFVPPLAIILVARLRNWMVRAVIGLGSLAAVVLTTQKGSLLAFAPVIVAMCLPLPTRLRVLRVCCIAFVFAGIALPFLAMGLHFEHGNGVFSTESFYLRVTDTWPDAWQWILRHQMLIFGVGLGGIGGAQRVYAFDSFNPADNLFILIYAYFGVFGLLYLSLVCWLALRRITGSTERAATAMAILAFCLGYGTVLSVIEDQSAALFLGTALGGLYLETRVTANPAGRTPTP